MKLMTSCFLVLLFICIVAVQAVSVFAQERISFRVVFEGDIPDCPEVWAWVKDLPEELAPNVQWSGKVSFVDRDNNYAAIYYYDVYSGEKVSKTQIAEAVFKPGLTCFEYQMLAQKELVGGPAAHSWLIAHPTYYTNGAEILFVADGIALLHVQNITSLFAFWGHDIRYPITYWDGKSYPTCEQLFQLRALQKSGYTRSDVHGDDLLIRNNCILRHTDFPIYDLPGLNTN